MKRDMLRICRFSPYRRGMGPTFSLSMWATGRTDLRGQTVIGYALVMHHSGTTPNPIVLFRDEDFCPGMGTPDDSDAAVAGLMGFLTLKPGDTDADYFANDTAEQRAYREQHAESLACAVMNRYGEL